MMIQISRHEYAFLVRPGSARQGLGPGYLYVEGNVSDFLLKSLCTLEKQASDVARSELFQKGDKASVKLWKDRLTMMTTLCRSRQYFYEKIDGYGLQRKRNRSFVLGHPFTYITPGCEWLYTEGEFGVFEIRRPLALVCYGVVTEALKGWLERVDARFREVLPVWGADSEQFLEALLSVLDKAGERFGVYATLMPVQDVDWLKSRNEKR